MDSLLELCCFSTNSIIIGSCLSMTNNKNRNQIHDKVHLVVGLTHEKRHSKVTESNCISVIVEIQATSRYRGIKGQTEGNTLVSMPYHVRRPDIKDEYPSLILALWNVNHCALRSMICMANVEMQ